MSPLKFLTTLLLVLPALLATARAAEIRAYVQPASARPNQIVSYVITVRDGEVSAVPGLRFPLQVTQASGVSTSRQFGISNGQRTSTVQLAWGISASEPGEFVIPPQDIVVDGQMVKTPECKLTVVQGGEAFPQQPGAAAPDAAREPILQLELGKKEIYLGEVVPLNCTLYVPREAPLRRLGLIDIEKTNFAIARFPQQSEQTSTVIDGIGYNVLTFRSTLSPLHAGDLQVGPAKMEILVEVPVQGQQRQMLPPGFPQVFFGGSEPRKLIVQSPQVRLKVLPLPTEGKPAGFNGAVGDFSISASASPTELIVGDPLSVDMIVVGSGNFDALVTPGLVQPSGWRLYPAKRYSIEGNLDPNMPPTLERKIGFSQVMVPDAVHPAVPPFEMSFFSPTQKQYVTVRTEAIPLVMRPAAALPPAAAGVAAAATGTAVPPPAMKPRADITDIVVKPSPRAHWVMPPGALLVQNRNFWTLQIVPVGMLIFAAMVALVRRRREARRSGLAGELRDAWASLEAGAANDTEFLRRAAQLILQAHAGQPVTDPALKGILDRYQSTNFSVANTASLSGRERQDVMRTLAPLVRHSVAIAVILIASLLLGTPGAVSAQSAKPAVAAATPDEIYRQAVGEIEKGNFTKAQYLAESLTKKKPPQLSSEVFELIGHARYKQDDIGRAALWYQRAQLLDARSPELRQNLRHLRERLGFITFSPGSPLTAWSYWFGPNEWVLIAAGGLWLVLLALAWRVLVGRRGTGWVIALSILGFLVAVPAATFAALRVPGPERVQDINVVVLPEVQAYTAATVTAGSVIDLPPGSQVRLLERRGAWAYVEIPNEPEHLRGWVEVPAMAPLWPWDPVLLP